MKKAHTLHGFLSFFCDFWTQVQIAESQPSPYHKSKSKNKGKRHRPVMSGGTPAFVCEVFEVDVSMKDVVDFGEAEDT